MHPVFFCCYPKPVASDLLCSQKPIAFLPLNSSVKPYSLKFLTLRMSKTIFKPGYQIRDQAAVHFLTFTVCGWIDLFTRKIYRDIVIDSFRHCQSEKSLVIYAYVIMSNHIHIIAQSGNPKNCTLSDIIRDFKRHTHKAMMEVIESDQESRRLWMLHQFRFYGGRNSKNERYQIWTNNNHPEECFSDEFTQIKLGTGGYCSQS